VNQLLRHTKNLAVAAGSGNYQHQQTFSKEITTIHVYRTIRFLGKISKVKFQIPRGRLNVAVNLYNYEMRIE
jgi:hypothetical protein